MRLSFFVPWITTGRGGTEHVGAVMANAMARRGHHVTVHTFDDDPAGQAQWPLAAGIGLRVHPTALDTGAETRLLMELAAERPDLIVGLHMNRTLFTYVWAGQKLGVPVLLSEHADPRLPQSLDTFTHAERMLAFAGASAVHVLIPPFRDELPPSLRAKVFVLPNRVAPARQMADPAGRGRLLLCVARLVPAKNVAALITAFARAPSGADWRLRLVGYGPEQTRLEGLTRTLGIAARVSFVHETTDVYSHYAKAQLFCLPSKLEAFGLTVAEAMAHGLPAVGLATNRGVSSVIVDGETGRLAANDGDALRDALEELMSDPAARIRMGDAGLRLFQDQYDIDGYGAALEAMVAAAAARPIVRPGDLGDPLGPLLASRLRLGPDACFTQRLRSL
jgi:glycosyltransferase involved in cell wall biosynthesis